MNGEALGGLAMDKFVTHLKGRLVVMGFAAEGRASDEKAVPDDKKAAEEKAPGDKTAAEGKVFEVTAGVEDKKIGVGIQGKPPGKVTMNVEAGWGEGKGVIEAIRKANQAKGVSSEAAFVEDTMQLTRVKCKCLEDGRAAGVWP